MKDFNILIVEDESLVAHELCQNIKNMKYKFVEYATTTQMALDIISKVKIDLLLLDINLNEKIDGIEFYEKLPYKISVIYLTAYGDNNTIARAIKTNPLGYLIKPHKDKELEAILKLSFYKLKMIKNNFENSNLLKIGEDYYYDKSKSLLYFQEEHIKLSKTETKLLELLIDAKGNIIDLSSIEYNLWPDKIVSASSLRTLIYRLRSKLNYKFIKSEYSLGLKLDIE